MPAGSQKQLVMPSYEVQQQMKQQQTSTWDKFNDWAENTGDAMQAGAVGYATGATLGNFDETMGTATMAITFNPNNYTMGRDATRQLQKELQQRHPYIYSGAEILGATTTSMFTNPILSPVVAGIGYAENINSIPLNIGKNAIVTRYTNGLQKIGFAPEELRHLGQNAASKYLLDKENYEK